MRIDMDEIYVNRSRTITPLNEVDCTRNVETLPPNKHLTQCRLIVRAGNMHSAEERVFIVREYWPTGSFQ
jgi:hypothetical protein